MKCHHYEGGEYNHPNEMDIKKIPLKVIYTL